MEMLLATRWAARVQSFTSGLEIGFTCNWMKAKFMTVPLRLPEATPPLLALESVKLCVQELRLDKLL